VRHNQKQTLSSDYSDIPIAHNEIHQKNSIAMLPCCLEVLREQTELPRETDVEPLRGVSTATIANSSHMHLSIWNVSEAYQRFRQILRA
jgi:hypothetical protein